ncbi:hypothetical protein [uncultured Subdoligranulum sp.]|uniref:hypothetical protein n=1 Tax=uncultured Subdoligranulum sp. TaxID=512298 RepID=UPI00320A9B81
MYTNQEKREIERVLTAFKPYIEQADYVEIVWSNKKQCYVALFIDTTRDTFEGADAILSAEEISERFYTEIGNDVLLENDREYQIWEMSPLEREEFLRRIQPYDAQLPEYHFLVEQLLSQPSQAE